jgi:hypothetical protein
MKQTPIKDIAGNRMFTAALFPGRFPRTMTSTGTLDRPSSPRRAHPTAIPTSSTEAIIDDGPESSAGRPGRPSGNQQ